MQSRHRIPTIFNLSMVDVLCCALGCVILLWLLNLREARHRAAQAGMANAQLSSAEIDLQTARDELRGLRKRAADLQAQVEEAARQAKVTGARLLAAEEQARSTAAKLQTAQADWEKTRSQMEKDVADLKAENTASGERLAKKTQDARELDKKMTAASQRVTTLETLVREKEMLANSTARRADDLAEKLSDADAQRKKLQPLADLVPGLREDVKTYRDKAAAAEALAAGRDKEAGKRMEDLQAARRALERDIEAKEKELSAASRSIEVLQGEKKLLALETDRTRAAAETRFAGIELTGRRVVFLVDMSGSMRLVNETTPAPGKWEGVAETVGRIMRSLPELEKYQVIVFSDKTSYLFGQDGRWLDYDRRTSAKDVVKAVTAIEPRGGTNMYSALEAAFRLRPLGLDAIYLMSDGLPNIGAGLTTEQSRTLKETEQGEILGKYILKTLKTDWNRDTPGRPRVRIDSVGFFFESPDVGAFLWSLSRENDGSFVGMSKP